MTKMDKRPCNSSHDLEVRKGPWTMEEDLILINYIANHGEGVWNSLARSAGTSSSSSSSFIYLGDEENPPQPLAGEDSEIDNREN